MNVGVHKDLKVGSLDRLLYLGSESAFALSLGGFFFHSMNRTRSIQFHLQAVGQPQAGRAAETRTGNQSGRGTPEVHNWGIN